MSSASSLKRRVGPETVRAVSNQLLELVESSISVLGPTPEHSDSDTMVPSNSPKPLLHFPDPIQPERGDDSHLLLFGLKRHTRRDGMTRTKANARGRKTSRGRHP